MIKTKFWFFCVLVLLLVGVNLLHTAQRQHADLKSDAEARLAWAEGRITELQGADHQGPLEAAVSASALSEVRDLLIRAHEEERAPDAEGFETVIQALGEAAARGTVPHQQLVVATTYGASRFSVDSAPEHEVEAPDVAAFRAAFAGNARAGLSVWNGDVVRVAAAPVATGDEVIGVVLLGYPLDATYASRYRDALGLDVTVVADGEVVVSSLPADRQADLVAAARRAAPGRAFGYGRVDGMALGLTAAITGVEPVLGMAQSVALAGVDQGVAVLSISTEEGYRWLDEYQTYQVGALGLLLLVGLIWGFFIAQSASGPLGDITGQLSRAASGDLNARLEPKKYRGPFRRFAEVINGILEQVEHKAPVAPKAFGKKEEDISSLLPDSPPPPEEPSPDAFDFGSMGQASAEPAPPASLDGPPPAPLDAPPTPDSDPGDFDPFSADSPAPPPPAPEPAFGSPPPAPEPAFGSSPEPAFDSPPEPAGQDDDSDSTRVVSLDAMQAAAQASESGDGLGEASLGQSPSAQATAASSLADASDDPFAAAYSEPGDFDDEDGNPDATVVAKVPTALLQATARAGGGGAATPADPDEAHFREVFREFVNARQKCGEPADGLTYEKFAVKLRKNRDTIKGKHGARGVRFQVYVKDGKAALKATPIK